MPDFGFDLDEVARLVRLVEERGLSKLEIEEENRRLVIRASASSGSPTVHVSPVAATTLAQAPRPVHHGKRHAIESPMVGVFYRSGSPDSPPLAEVGDHIEVGQAIGLIEAMKVFSEIPSDHAGTVLEILCSNGDLVRQGQPIMYLSDDS